MAAGKNLVMAGEDRVMAGEDLVRAGEGAVVGGEEVWEERADGRWTSGGIGEPTADLRGAASGKKSRQWSRERQRSGGSRAAASCGS